MSDPPYASILTADAIDIDLACHFCGYNLRSLSIDGNCPECGNPVRLCIRQGWLGFADRTWLARLRRGVSIYLWMLLAGAAYCIGQLIYTFASAVPSGPGVPQATLGYQAANSAIGIIFSVAWLAAVWHLTSPEPIPERGLHQSSVAKAARWLLVVSLSLSILMYLLGIVRPLFGGEPASVDPIGATGFGYTGGVVAVPNGILGGVGSFLLLIHMRRIARRNAKKGLGKLMTTIIWGTVGLIVGGGGLAVIVGLSAWAAPRAAVTTTMFSTTGPGTQPATSTRVLPDGSVVSETSEGDVAMVVEVRLPGTATTLPTTTSSMPAGGFVPPRRLARGAFMFAQVGMCGGCVFFLAYGVCGVVALFWFRRVFTRAMEGPGDPEAVGAA